MIGKTERKDKAYKQTLRQLVTFAFVKASAGGCYRVTLEDIWLKHISMSKTDIISYMDEPVVKNIFSREIGARGVVYTMNAKFRTMEFDEMFKYVNKELKKCK